MNHNWLTQDALWAWEPHAELTGDNPQPLQTEETENQRSGFRMLANGIAILDLVGLLTKQGTDDGSSTRWARQMVNQAADDPKVSALLLHIDSPGGQVAGTHDLATALYRFSQRKPVVAYIEDVGCSAAYWIACAADAIYCNPTAAVGGVGVLLLVADSSRALEQAGVRIHAIATGDRKRVGAPGQPLLPSDAAYLQRYVRTVGSVFTRFVQRRRKLNAAQAKEVFTGKVFVGQQAVAAGLVDAVLSLDEAVARLQERVQFQNGEGSLKQMDLQQSLRQVLAALKRGQLTSTSSLEERELEANGALEEEIPDGLAELEPGEEGKANAKKDLPQKIGHEVRMVLQLYGIETSRELCEQLELAKLGAEALAQARAEAKKAAIRLYGAENGIAIGAQVDFEPMEVVRAKASAWNSEADARFGIEANGKALRASAPCSLPSGVEEQKPVGAWAKLSAEQKALAIKMGFTTPERQEAFAENLLQAVE